MAFVYITCQDKKEAKKISRRILEKRLAGCTNIFPIESSYWWKGEIVDDKEYAILAKTFKKNFTKIKNEVTKIHSYTVPCICLLKAKSNKEYEKWLKNEII